MAQHKFCCNVAKETKETTTVVLHFQALHFIAAVVALLAVAVAMRVAVLVVMMAIVALVETNNFCSTDL